MRLINPRWWRQWRRQRPRVSPLTKRILAVNALPLLVLFAGLLYMDQYRQSLLQSELDTLQAQARLLADVLGEVAISPIGDAQMELAAKPASDLIRRILTPGAARARLFDRSGNQIIDSRSLGARKGRRNSLIQIENLAEQPAGGASPWQGMGELLDSWGMRTAWSWRRLPVYTETDPPRAQDYAEVLAAMSGERTTAVYRAFDDRDLVLTAALPIQHYRQVLGVLLVSKTGEHIETVMAEIWAAILKIFLVALVVTLLLSLYLASTLSRPILRLADAARRMRHTRNRAVVIPDLRARQDEIGELSTALRDLTQALWDRLDAIEHFAADVAHEIKNPLNSLRSAVETARRVTDPQQQKQLWTIIVHDVQRLDRLITDIAEASRVDSDLSKATNQDFAVIELLAQVIEAYRHTTSARHVRIELLADPTAPCMVHGVPGRLAQVIRNVLDNALSFSPPDGVIAVSVQPAAEQCRITIADQGPGIPSDRLDKIFDRFYTDRPAGEKFGQHSGLGLSISRQIVVAMGGTVMAENTVDSAGKITGAQFTITLPGTSLMMVI